MYRAMIVDDDLWALKDIQAAFPFASYGFDLACACTSAEEASVAFDRLRPELLITDIQLKQKNGLALLRECKALREDMVAVILSGHDDFSYARQALNDGAYYYMLKPVDDAEAEGLLRKIYQLLCSRGTPQKGGEDVVFQMCSFINDHLSPSLSLNDLSARFAFNRTYISELFQERMGISFSQYKKKQYLKKAHALLQNPNAKIADVAEACGFQDIRYFSRWFKEMTQMTPREYAKTLGQNDYWEDQQHE